MNSSTADVFIVMFLLMVAKSLDLDASIMLCVFAIGRIRGLYEKIEELNKKGKKE